MIDTYDVIESFSLYTVNLTETNTGVRGLGNGRGNRTPVGFGLIKVLNKDFQPCIVQLVNLYCATTRVYELHTFHKAHVPTHTLTPEVHWDKMTSLKDT